MNRKALDVNGDATLREIQEVWDALGFRTLLRTTV